MDSKKQEKVFFSPKGEFSQKLTDAEAAKTVINATAALVFSGEIDIERFCQAMETSSKDFYWLFCKLKERKGEIFAEYTGSGENNKNKDAHFTLEIETINKPFDKNDPSDLYYPKKIHKKMKTPILAFVSVNNLSFSAFKLSVLNDSFVIACMVNHSYFDGYSLYYYFLYLSDIYNHGHTQLKKPSFKGKSIISNGRSFKNQSEHIKNTPDNFSLKTSRTNPLTYIPRTPGPFF